MQDYLDSLQYKVQRNRRTSATTNNPSTSFSLSTTLTTLKNCVKTAKHSSMQGICHTCYNAVRILCNFAIHTFQAFCVRSHSLTPALGRHTCPLVQTRTLFPSECRQDVEGGGGSCPTLQARLPASSPFSNYNQPLRNTGSNSVVIEGERGGVGEGGWRVWVRRLTDGQVD